MNYASLCVRLIPKAFVNSIQLAFCAIILYTVIVFSDSHSLTIQGQSGADPDLPEEVDAPPNLVDDNLRIEEVVDGLSWPTAMAFVDKNDILVLEKNDGTVRRILNGTVLEDPVLDVNVANENERGILGIAVDNKPDKDSGNELVTYVYISFTESVEDGSDECSSSTRCEEEELPLGNRLYRYEWIDNKLVNPELLLDLPAKPGPSHNGGAVVVGPDNNVYLTIGDLRGSSQNPKTSEDAKNGLDPDGRSGILRITQDGEIVKPSILGDEHPLNMYYAYGIRNSFGLDFDPLTGNLWDTENGPEYGDEINLVEPGFNSGWEVVQGMMKDPQDLNLLEDFGGKGKYSDPEFVWKERAGPTAIKFLDSDRLGKRYENSIFVGDVHTGNIYNFELNNERTKLMTDGLLEDKEANDDHNIPDQEVGDTIFGRNFGSVVDLDVGPDGLLYIVSLSPGKIFKILPVE